MDLFMLVVVAIWLGFLVFIFANMYRLKRFSRFMGAEIDRVAAERLAGTKSAWPDVSACYDNLKWYEPFNYNFKNLMVYDAR